MGNSLRARPIERPRAAAQATGQQGTARLTGVVFDSTAMNALPGARVAVLGTNVMGDADADGRFNLTGVPEGSHWVSFFHPRLQALGVSPPSRQVTFRDGQAVDVVLAVPSDRTLLMGWCMAEQSGPAFGALAGLVADSLTGVPLPGAVVKAQLASRRPGDLTSDYYGTDRLGGVIVAAEGQDCNIALYKSGKCRAIGVSNFTLGRFGLWARVDASRFRLL